MTNSGKSARASASVFEESGREADLMAAKVAALRAELNPLAAAQDRVNAEIAEYAALAARGAISADELAQAQAMARGRSAANQNAYRGVNQFNTGNIAAQFQDIAVTSAMGMSPLQIALQQGTQLSAVLGPMGAAGAAKTLGAALVSIVNPASLVVLGLVGATAAAIQYFSSTKSEAKTTDDLLKAHKASITGLRDVWGEAADAKSRYGRESIGSAAFGIESSISDLTKRLREANAPTTFGKGAISAAILGAVEDNRDLVGMSGREFRESSLFKTLQIDFEALQAATIKGEPGVLRVIRNLEGIGQTSGNAGIKAIVTDAVAALEPFRQLAEAIQEARRELDRLAKDIGTRGLPGFLLSQGTTNREDMGNLALFESREAIAAARRQQSTDASLLGIGARSPAERAAAARAAAAAQYDDSETAAARRDRIDTAGKLELARATHILTEAQDQRARSLDQTLAQQQLEISLIGQTAGEAARLRMEFEQISRIREEAARNGVEADEKEIAAIKAKADAYGKVADEIARANLARDLNFERDQQFRSAQDQAIASRQQGAGLAVDLNSPAAQQMRDLARFADAKGLAVGFLTDFKSELLSNGGDVGKALGESILNALTTSMDKQLSDIFDRLGTWIAAALTGQRPGAGLGGGAGFVADTTLSAFLGASNDNYAPGAVTRSPLAAVGAGSGSMAAYASAIREIESAGSGGYSALGPWTRGDRAYGAYQVMGNNIPSWSQDALGKSLTPSQFLADPAAQDAIFKNQFGKYLSKYGNPQDAASAWFTGGPLKTGAGARDVLGTSGSAYVDKFNAAVNRATEGLGGLDTTVTNTVQSLAGGLGGKGGLASILDGLKPGNFQANTSLSAILGYGGSAPAPTGGGGGIFSALLSFIPKLFGFANGTDFAPGGLARINEKGGEIVDLPRGSRVIPHDVSMRMAANANRSSQPSKVDFNINLDGANGDDHVRMLARQGAQEAISQYHEAQSRGGFGELQRQYASQKG
ncbi:MAG: hypothetical protein EOR08_08395 [Mesorhizobium sp.]|nr:MAG: hypothetical protein EOR08_08395 [Mesorhizobium sp.]